MRLELFHRLRRMASAIGGRRVEDATAWSRFHCDQQASSSWQGRAETAADLWREHHDGWLPAGRSHLRIADFGAGNERLRAVLNRKLRQPHVYVAYDLHPQKASTICLDLLEGVPRGFDVVFCLGLLEYLPTDSDFIAGLRGAGQFVIVSYNFADCIHPLTVPEREKWGWLSHRTRAELEAVFSANGFVREDFVVTDAGKQGVWLWAVAA
jgi:hypothetical protein